MTQPQYNTLTDSQLLDFIVETIDDIKAQDIITLDVDHLTEMFEHMVIATATSKQHARSISRHLVEEAKSKNIHMIGVEGDDTGEWVLVDFGGTIAHIMTEEMRKFYELEKLWGIPKEDLK
jgi:ribosome-associated protein